MLAKVVFAVQESATSNLWFDRDTRRSGLSHVLTRRPRKGAALLNLHVEFVNQSALIVEILLQEFTELCRVGSNRE